MCGREKQPSHPIATSMILRRDRRTFIGKNEANPWIMDKGKKRKGERQKGNLKRKRKYTHFQNKSDMQI